jgi:predicted SnoaL-like aldol condensation-catalyzing enzyme
MATSNLELFRAIVERGFSRGELAIADELCADKFVEHEYLARNDVPGPAILKAQIEEARNAIANLKLTIEAAVETSDTVWARTRATGSDPRSGKPVAIDVFDICRFKNGKVVEHWGVPDRFALLHQTGALTRPFSGSKPRSATDGQIEKLAQRIAKESASADDIVHELRELLFAFDGAYYQEKIRNALDLANKYFAPSRAGQAGSSDAVRSKLLEELESAAQEAKELEGG